MALNLSGLLSDSLSLVMQIVKDVEEAGSAGKAIEEILIDPKVMASVSALIKDLIG